MQTRRSEILPLIVLIIVAGGILGFAELAQDVREGNTNSFDKSVLISLREPADRSDPIGPRWLEEMMRDFTALGSHGVVTLLTLGVCAFLVLDGKGRAALLVLLAVGGAMIWSPLLKEGFQRARPDLVPHGQYVYTKSFPSGHSMLAAAAYLGMGALLARVQGRRRLKVFLISFAVLLTLVVGFSRVYLGVHWPTDVLAGWTAGGIWALLCWFLARWLQRRGEVEPAGPPDDETLASR